MQGNAKLPIMTVILSYNIVWLTKFIVFVTLMTFLLYYCIMEIRFDLCKSLCHRDPQETELGKKMIENSIVLIDEIGFEAFTFKKLAQRIGSTEKSIYRYFENKHLLLVFLTSWYWEWVRYLIEINIKNIESAPKKLKIAIANLVEATAENPGNKYINENLLHRLVIQEGGKAYHITAVDDENKVGMYLSYKKLVKLVADIILEVNPKFKYSSSLSSNLFEMANNQVFFAEHIPQLSSIASGKKMNQDLIDMLWHFSGKILNQEV